jgi:hypothetical protein
VAASHGFRHAAISPESIHKGFGSKATLARAVFDVPVVGDDEPVPVAQRPAAAEVRDEPDVRRKIAIFVEGLVDRLARSAKVFILIRTAGTSTTLWHRSGRRCARKASPA